MPELPDITVYCDALRPRIEGTRLTAVQLANPFILRSVTPPLDEFTGREVAAVERLGKRIVIGVEGELFLVLHLMIAGRLHWTDAGRAPKKGLATFTFDRGALVLTEAGTKRRASLTAVAGRAALAAMDRGGLEVLGSDDAAIIARLRRANHTLKRALTDPRIFDGIGNAYSDEILHAAQLSPLQLTGNLTDAQAQRLATAMRDTLTLWIARQQAEVGAGWPVKVTAFRPDMMVHGRYGMPCPVCGASVQRIRYAENETNYCARCQTGGRLLADRAMSRLLREDWPRSLDEL